MFCRVHTLGVLYGRWQSSPAGRCVALGASLISRSVWRDQSGIKVWYDLELGNAENQIGDRRVDSSILKHAR